MIWSEQSERGAIGVAMLDNALFDEMGLEAWQFYHPRHRAAWEAITALRGAGEDANFVTVFEWLERRGQAGDLTLSALSDMAGEAIQDSGFAQAMAATVRRDSFSRSVRSELTEALAGGLEGDELLADVIARTTALHAKSQRDERFATMPDVLKRTFNELAERVDGGGMVNVLPTGLADLDACIGGLRLGVVSLIGGRTSMGKSALSRSIAFNVADAGHGVHFFTLEDSSETLVTRQLSDLSGVELERFHVPKRMTAVDMQKITGAHPSLSSLQRWGLEDTPTMSSAQIAMSVRRRKREIGTKLVVVDYAQLVNEKAPSPRERINLAVEGLFRLARQENVAVLLVSQVNRGNDKEQRRPRLSDLKESGTLEEQAYVAMLVHRGQDEEGQEEAGVVVAKNKNGRTGWVPLVWHGPTATYRSKRW